MNRLTIQGGDPARVSPRDAGGEVNTGKAGQAEALRSQIAQSVRVAPPPANPAPTAYSIAAGAIAEISAAGREAVIQAATRPGPGPAVTRPARALADVARDARREIRYLFEQGLAFSDSIQTERMIAERVSRETAPIIAAANRAAAMQGPFARSHVEDAAHLLRYAQAA